MATSVSHAGCSRREPPSSTQACRVLTRQALEELRARRIVERRVEDVTFAQARAYFADCEAALMPDFESPVP